MVDEEGEDVVKFRNSNNCGYPNFMKMFQYIIPVIFLVFVSQIAFAEIKTFEREYTYQASEADSKLTSRAIALEQVKRLLIEELGTYLESRTEVQDLKITKDQITTLSAGVVQTVILDEKWDGKSYWMKAKIDADPDKVVADLNNLRNDRQKAKEFEELKKTADDALAEIDRLKAQLAEKGAGESGTNTADNIRAETDKLTAKDWIEKGQYLYYVNDHEGAMRDYDKAIDLDPKLAVAYANRAGAKINLGDREGAIKDCNAAIELDPKLALAYVIRAWAKGNLKDYNGAIKDCNTAIELDPKFALAYYTRANSKAALGDTAGANSDYITSARLGYKEAQDWLTKKGENW